jgi:hypothetical protein
MQQIHFQIISALSMLKRLPELEKEFLITGSPENDFYQKLTGNEKLKNNEIHISDHCFAVGGVSWRQLTHDEQDLFVQMFGFTPATVLKVHTFSRLWKENEIYHSKAYSRVQNRNNYTITFSDVNIDKTNYGQIELFAQYKPTCLCLEAECSCKPINVMVISVLSRVEFNLINDDLTHASIPGIMVVTPPDSNKKAIVEIEQIQSKCIYMHFEDCPGQSFLAFPPNKVETG